MEILAVVWRSARDTVGIVLTESYGKKCVYMGVAQGGSEMEDASFIADYGCKLPFREARAFFPTLLKDENEYYGRGAATIATVVL